jgi:hypothetical protein
MKRVMITGIESGSHVTFQKTIILGRLYLGLTTLRIRGINISPKIMQSYGLLCQFLLYNRPINIILNNDKRAGLNSNHVCLVCNLLINTVVNVCTYINRELNGNLIHNMSAGLSL